LGTRRDAKPANLRLGDDSRHLAVTFLDRFDPALQRLAGAGSAEREERQREGRYAASQK
jgi:hypothetical protein